MSVFHSIISVLDGNTLLCPGCRGSYIHSADVVVFDRDEDAPRTAVTTIYHGGAMSIVSKPSHAATNPSTRRHGVAVRFWCEHCGTGDHLNPDYELTIAQHKGITFIEWRRAGEGG